jgi:RNA polymerase sigma-70 factor (ECF subfamily)
MKAEELHRRFAEPIRRLSRRMIRSRDLADDAAQETWAEIVKSLPSFRGESSPSTWIYTIARRTIMRTAAREKRYTARFLSEFFELHADEGLDQFSAQPDESLLNGCGPSRGLPECDPALRPQRRPIQYLSA